MKTFSRYDTSALEEAEFEAGSRGRVLKNLLGIRIKREMDQVEAREQLRALDEATVLLLRISARFIEFGLARSIRGQVDTAG